MVDRDAGLAPVRYDIRDFEKSSLDPKLEVITARFSSVSEMSVSPSEEPESDMSSNLETISDDIDRISHISEETESNRERTLSRRLVIAGVPIEMSLICNRSSVTMDLRLSAHIQSTRLRSWQILQLNRVQENV